jgi:hypothetical protein
MNFITKIHTHMLTCSFVDVVLGSAVVVVVLVLVLVVVVVVVERRRVCLVDITLSSTPNVSKRYKKEIAYIHLLTKVQKPYESIHKWRRGRSPTLPEGRSPKSQAAN